MPAKPNSEILRFLGRCLLLLPLALGPFLVNWSLTLPVMESQRSDAYHQMARTLILRKSIWLNADLRPLRTAFIRQLPAARSVLILGSSRAATIAAEWFPDGDAWNASIPAGGVEDAVSVFQACVEARRIPRTVILELFPTLTHEPEPFSSPLSFAPGAMLSGLEANAAVFLWKTDEQRPYGMQVFPDGHLRIGRDSQRTPAQIAAIVKSALAGISPRELTWRTHSQPDQIASLLFRRFLDDLQSRGIHVIVFLAPVNPLAWDFFSKRGGYDESWIRHELQPRGIPVVGSYSPVPFNAKPTDFFDTVHPVPALVRRILAEANVIPGPSASSAMAH
jgi:hypothetical protein